MTETSLKTIPLKNGLTLHLLDFSKKIAGDRWYVSVVAHMDIPINEETLGDLEKNERSSKPSLDDIIAVVGDTVTFEQKMERNFISNSEKDTIEDGFISSFLRLSATYLDRAAFAKKYILKVYKEKQKQQTWYK